MLDMPTQFQYDILQACEALSGHVASSDEENEWLTICVDFLLELFEISHWLFVWICC